MKLDAAFFKSNRDAAVRNLEGSLIVLAGYRSMQFSGDMAATFRQESNFWYLTGIDAPGWHLVVDGIRGKSWLVAPELSSTQVIFDGGLDWEEAKRRSGVDDIISAKQFDSVLQDLKRKHSLVYTIKDEKGHADFVLNPSTSELRERLDRIFDTVRDCRKEMARLRAIKQPAEIAAIRKAVHLTTSTFNDIKTKISTLSYEYELEGEFTYAFTNKHAKHAYDPIIATGRNACTLHYIENSSRLRQKQMVLMDVGAYVNGYAADITRTYITSGEPTPRAKEIHEALQTAQAKIIKLLSPGLDVMDYLRSVDDIMKHTLVELKLIRDISDEDAYRRIMPHAISHGLGIDVHDSLGSPKSFQPGMVLTVEPGIYIPELNLGIRLEDDVLITEQGHDNLSKTLSTTW